MGAVKKTPYFFESAIYLSPLLLLPPSHTSHPVYRSLPNWMRLRQGKPQRLGGEEEMKQTIYARESETLTANLGAELLRRSNIVSSHENLRLLAILHESLVSYSRGALSTIAREPGEGVLLFKGGS